MIVKIILEEEDYLNIGSLVRSASGFDYEYTNEELQTIWDALPESIKGEAVQWGISDSCVRDNIYTHVQEKLGEALRSSN